MANERGHVKEAIENHLAVNNAQPLIEFCSSAINLQEKVVHINNVAVGVSLEDGCELEISIGDRAKREFEENEYEEIAKKRKENNDDIEGLSNMMSPDTRNSVLGSSDREFPEFELGTEVAELEEYRELPNDEQDSPLLPLADYPLVDRFPDLDHVQVEPECGCCYCDMTDKKGLTTSEPDLVLYSDRTSDTIMPDCRYFKERQGRDTGYSVWEVED